MERSSEESTKSIDAEYRDTRRLYEDLSIRARRLVDDILSQAGIRIHSITTRVKNSASLSGKLKRSSGEYKTLSDITDLCGIRIITYFEDDVERAAKVIESEFTVDKENSIDKGTLQEPDRFGYRSLHFVVQFQSSRVGLVEYKQFAGIKFEIQIRSILQHAWAEIEHDLGYKTEKDVPKEIRRDFSRLAGLLELADSEFIRIRNVLTSVLSERSRTVLNTTRPTPQQKRILILGWEIGEILSQTLQTEGYETKLILYHGGPLPVDQVFSELSSERYDLVVVSLWNFWEVLLEIRRRFPSIKTIFMNSYKPEWDGIALQRGVNAVIRVPFEYQEVVGQIKELIS